MRLCTHGRQTYSKEIDQTATFWCRFFYKTLRNTTLNKPLWCNNFLLQQSFFLRDYVTSVQ